MTTAIGYVRRSTNRQEESLEQQRSKLESFASARGWTLGTVYVDDAISGSDMTRPGLEALMRHATTGQDVDIVMAWERNRLARPKDPVDGLMLERAIIKAGKRVVYVATGQEADQSFASGLIGYVEHYQNGDYLRKLSRDAMRGIVSRAKRGLWPSGQAPFGYDRLCLSPDGTPRRIIRNLPDQSQIVMHPATREIMERVTDGHRYKKPEYETVTLIPSEPVRVAAVRRLFADYLAGVPFRLLRDTLNATGLRTVFGGVFTIGTLHGILRNPAYIGKLVYNRSTWSKWHRHVGGSEGRSMERQDEGGEQRPQEDWIVVENAWPALVDAETFAKVQARLQEVKDQNLHVTGNSIRTEYILGGVLCCSVCGGRLMGQTDKIKTKAGKRRSYVCGTHHKGDFEKCPTRYRVPADRVERHIIGLIQEDLHALKGDPQLQDTVSAEVQKLCGSQVDARQGLRARLSEIDGQMAKLTAHLSVLDLQTATTLGLYAKAKTLASERQQVAADLAAASAGVPEMPTAAEIARRAAEELAQIETLLASGTLEQKREIVRTYVKSMKADPATQEIELCITPALFSRIVTGGAPHPGARERDEDGNSERGATVLRSREVMPCMAGAWRAKRSGDLWRYRWLNAGTVSGASFQGEAAVRLTKLPRFRR